MGVLATGFASFFFSMKYRDEKRRSSGNLQQCEPLYLSRLGGTSILPYRLDTFCLYYSPNLSQTNTHSPFDLENIISTKR